VLLFLLLEFKRTEYRLSESGLSSSDEQVKYLRFHLGLDLPGWYLLFTVVLRVLVSLDVTNLIAPL
jgi:hypothetical protein